MSKDFKPGIILKILFDKYFLNIPKSFDYLETLSLLDDKIVVFIGKNVNFVEYLYLNYILRNFNKNIAYTNEMKTFLWESPNDLFEKIIKSQRTNLSKLRDNVEKGFPSLIFLKKSKFLNLSNREFESNPLLNLIEIKKSIDKDIILVPEILSLEKNPSLLGKKKNKSSAQILFELGKNYKKSYASLLEPISLNEFIKNNNSKSNENLAESLKSKILFKIYKELELITGPAVLNRDDNLNLLLKNPNIEKVIEDEAKRKKTSKDKTRKKAKNILEKISADYKNSMINKFSYAINHLVSKLYKKVFFTEESVKYIKELEREYTLILAPSHKSHIDYLIISYIFYKNGIVPPHIAAGENLTFFPMGFIFRRSGAFFLKRSFRDDKFYSVIFTEYLKKLVKDRFTIEFFIEGTRSRTGKLLPPKTGMMSMFLEAFLEGHNKKLAVLPISISYEKIIEEKSYVKELSGQDKKKEDINAMLNNRKVFKSRFGNIYIDLGEAIKLDKYFKNIKNIDIKEHSGEIAYKVMHRINSASTVTTSSILGLALLSDNNNKDCYEFDEILGIYLYIYKELQKKDLNFSNTLRTPVIALEEALEFFISNKHIEILEDESYKIIKSRRSAIEYYKNSIIHNFIYEAMIIISVKEYFYKHDIKNNVNFLFSIFKDEFIFNYSEKFDTLLNNLIDKNLILNKEDKFVLNYKKNTMGVNFYINVIYTFLESYYFCIDELILLKDKSINFKSLLKHLIHNLSKNPNILYKESINKDKLSNCINMLIKKDILKKKYKGRIKLVIKNSDKGLIELKEKLNNLL